MAAAQKNRYGAVYGLAKGLGMDRESLHEYIYRETGRASLTELTDPELRLSLIHIWTSSTTPGRTVRVTRSGTRWGWA